MDIIIFIMLSAVTLFLVSAALFASVGMFTIAAELWRDFRNGRL